MGNSLEVPKQQPERLKEFSVVYTGAALNLMSSEFQTCMRDISSLIRSCYNAAEFVLIPGSGSFAMEAVVRQFILRKKTLIIRNGWFGYRWTQILEMANEQPSMILLAKAIDSSDPSSEWTPPDLTEVLEKIAQEKPSVVIASHVETSTGIILPMEYIKAIGEACRKIDSIFVLDCIASGAIWVDMQDNLVDILISAPQKAWSGPACCGFVLLQQRAVKVLQNTTSNSFTLDLKKWREVMQKYQDGGFMYHTTLPTDALLKVRDKMFETRDMGFDQACQAQKDLGRRIREVLNERGFTSVAAPEYAAPGVVVVHIPPPLKSPEMVKRFMEQGLQIAGGMKFQCQEHEKTETFRIGLFGLEKWKDVDGTVETFKKALNATLESHDEEQQE